MESKYTQEEYEKLNQKLESYRTSIHDLNMELRELKKELFNEVSKIKDNYVNNLRDGNE
jgi:predicted  nucleic acid-binding Zn-ribbon protein